MRPLRLDQIGAIEKLIERHAQAAGSIRSVVMRPARGDPGLEAEISSDVVKVIGHVVLTLGFGMALDPTVRRFLRTRSSVPSSAC